MTLQRAQDKSDSLKIKLLEEELRIVRNELHVAELKIQDLLEVLDAANLEVFPFEWGLTATEASLLRLLYNSKQVTKEAALSYLYRNNHKDLPEIKIIDVYVSKIRKKFKEHGSPITINTIWGVGYSLADESKTYIDNLIKSKRRLTPNGT